MTKITDKLITNMNESGGSIAIGWRKR